MCAPLPMVALVPLLAVALERAAPPATRPTEMSAEVAFCRVRPVAMMLIAPVTVRTAEAATPAVTPLWFFASVSVATTARMPPEEPYAVASAAFWSLPVGKFKDAEIARLLSVTVVPPMWASTVESMCAKATEVPTANAPPLRPAANAKACGVTVAAIVAAPAVVVVASSYARTVDVTVSIATEPLLAMETIAAATLRAAVVADAVGVSAASMSRPPLIDSEATELST